MSDQRERASLSTVGARPDDDHAQVERMFAAWLETHGTTALAGIVGRWLRDRGRGVIGKLLLLFAGAGAGVGGTTVFGASADDDAPSPNPSAGPSNTGPLNQASPSPPPAIALEQPATPAGDTACQQCRDDARIAIELLSAQLAECGAENIPRPPAPKEPSQ